MKLQRREQSLRTKRVSGIANLSSASVGSQMWKLPQNTTIIVRHAHTCTHAQPPKRASQRMKPKEVRIWVNSTEPAPVS